MTVGAVSSPAAITLTVTHGMSRRSAAITAPTSTSSQTTSSTPSRSNSSPSSTARLRPNRPMKWSRHRGLLRETVDRHEWQSCRGERVRTNHIDGVSEPDETITQRGLTSERHVVPQPSGPFRDREQRLGVSPAADERHDDTHHTILTAFDLGTPHPSVRTATFGTWSVRRPTGGSSDYRAGFGR